MHIFKSNKRRNNIYAHYKRLQDIILSGAAIIILAPFMLLVAIAIVIDDPLGGPIYRQRRIGKDGIPFWMYKFRTMHRNADKMLKELQDQNEADGPVFKIKDDPRITRIGKILRKTCIDELPQFVNVLKGDMSIVGPRPPLPREVAKYSDYHMIRLTIMPGLTCYWQITPDKHDMPFDDWVELDRKYIRKQSFFTDWYIIIRTVGVIFRMDGV